MDKIKILHVFSDPHFGVFILQPLLKRQKESGYDVEIACGSGEYFRELEDLGYKVYDVSFSRKLFSFSHLISLIKVGSIIRKNGYQVLHAHTPTASFVSRLSAKINDVPIIISHMRTSWWDSEKKFIRFVFTILEKISCFWTDFIFTINCTDANELKSRKLIDPHKVECLHCGGIGIDLEKYNPNIISNEDAKRLRSTFGIDEDDFVYGFVGRLVEEKGIFDLLNAYIAIRNLHPKTKLLLVGGVLSSERDQNSLERFNNFILQNNLNTDVIITGFRKDIPSFLRIMNLLILPSYREGFGMVLAEAMAMGCPVISSDTRGGIEAIKNRETGYIYKKKDIKALFDCMEEITSSEEIQKKLSINGITYAREFFDLEKIYQKMNLAYEVLILKKYK